MYGVEKPDEISTHRLYNLVTEYIDGIWGPNAFSLDLVLQMLRKFSDQLNHVDVNKLKSFILKCQKRSFVNRIRNAFDSKK